MNPKVDFYFDKEQKWQSEIRKLRKIILDCGLSEDLKWGSPCYTFQKKNIVLIHVFKEYCGVLFFKGALLQNEYGILFQQSENVQAARQVRFTSVAEVSDRESVLKSHIYEAIEVEKAGLKFELKKTSEFIFVEEFKNKLDEMPELKTAFEALTPGRQRGYLLYFSQPKQSGTREARIQKCVMQIFEGRGLKD
ncbi:YdeI family protein [Dyadobacter sp. CY312]|uniref:YdeI/OmpD-associated family protein n=1 Tax=Dyadobacter sp. CY312 TaxID=2907303 RepID=UPI001F2FDBD2|nr:DUF1801 domain-containing protein [Dyadobacter sp. CY312]MCE7040276.1 YdeI/OmpD-associated family protein [Dyadobacter sp. CY312]